MSETQLTDNPNQSQPNLAANGSPCAEGSGTQQPIPQRETSPERMKPSMREALGFWRVRVLTGDEQRLTDISEMELEENREARLVMTNSLRANKLHMRAHGEQMASLNEAVT
uniref:Uncharacterized protein n=1 Tax=Sphaerodactylus townsendi TaxID=933632 RepID=A0ACB8F712_9SAUR